MIILNPQNLRMPIQKPMQDQWFLNEVPTIASSFQLGKTASNLDAWLQPAEEMRLDKGLEGHCWATGTFLEH